MRGCKLHTSLYENASFLKVFSCTSGVSFHKVMVLFLSHTKRKTFAAVFIFWPAPIAFYLKYSCMNASNCNTVSNKHLSKQQTVAFQHKNGSLNSNKI